WSNIRLAVVSGRPVSFISRLYDPKYVERQSAELAESAPVGPIVHEGVVAGAPPPPPPPPAAARKAMRLDGRADHFASSQLAVTLAAPAEVPPFAEGAEVGELFEYNFTSPVTIKRGESALLPFLHEGVTARKLL